MNENHELPGPDDDWIVIFRPWKRLDDGTIIYAKSYGKKAFPIRIRRRKIDE